MTSAKPQKKPFILLLDRRSGTYVNAFFCNEEADNYIASIIQRNLERLQKKLPQSNLKDLEFMAEQEMKESVSLMMEKLDKETLAHILEGKGVEELWSQS